MIKIAELIALNTTMPSEEPRMRDFLKRGTRDQIDLYQNPYTVVGSSKGTIEGKGPLTPSKRPETIYTSNKYNVGYPWDLQDPNIFEDESESKIYDSLLGRELQTLSLVAKLASRLIHSGFTENEVQAFILKYTKSNETNP